MKSAMEDLKFGIEAPDDYISSKIESILFDFEKLNTVLGFKKSITRMQYLSVCTFLNRMKHDVADLEMIIRLIDEVK